MSRERAKLLNDDGIRMANSGNPELGRQKLLASIDEDPTWGVPWNNLGVIFRDLGDNSAALRCLGKATELGAFS
jgi:Flp pilus assembly protein TadD